MGYMTLKISVAVACFLPGQAKDLLALLYIGLSQRERERDRGRERDGRKKLSQCCSARVATVINKYILFVNGKG